MAPASPARIAWAARATVFIPEAQTLRNSRLFKAGRPPARGISLCCIDDSMRSVLTLSEESHSPFGSRYRVSDAGFRISTARGELGGLCPFEIAFLIANPEIGANNRSLGAAGTLGR